MDTKLYWHQLHHYGKEPTGSVSKTDPRATMPQPGANTTWLQLQPQGQ